MPIRFSHLAVLAEPLNQEREIFLGLKKISRRPVTFRINGLLARRHLNLTYGPYNTPTYDPNLLQVMILWSG